MLIVSKHVLIVSKGSLYLQTTFLETELAVLLQLLFVQGEGNLVKIARRASHVFSSGLAVVEAQEIMLADHFLFANMQFWLCGFRASNTQSHQIAAQKEKQLETMRDALGLKEVKEGEAFDRDLQEQRKQERMIAREEKDRERREKQAAIEEEEKRQKKEQRKEEKQKQREQEEEEHKQRKRDRKLRREHEEEERHRKRKEARDKRDS